jgi:hypothetical protein
MHTDHFTQLFPAVCAGFGLFLVGGANLLLAGRGLAVRATATLTAVGLALAGVAALEQPGATARTAAYLAATLIPCLLLGSRRLPELARALRRPAVRFGLVAAGGTALVVASFVAFEARDLEQMAANTATLETIPGGAQCVKAEGETVTTDQGTRIAVRVAVAPRDAAELQTSEDKALSAGYGDVVIRRGPVNDHTNCHGWVFTGGRYILGPDEVALILKENGYQEVAEPQAGDAVVYRIGNEIIHTAVVRYVSEGQPVLVEGKWGPLGVYLHPADKSTYGPDYTFYRSQRTGHLLAGIGKPRPKSEQPPPMVAE